MTPDVDIAATCGTARMELLATMDAIAHRARDFDLPLPPEALERYRSRLADNTYALVVIGEMKRGKSTLVNALVGRRVLPSDVDVATCQVFRVANATHEACRLRLEDGSTRDLTWEALAHVGSQAVIDRDGALSGSDGAAQAIRPGEVIRWVEVDLPIRFLPAGVTVLDTPGLGSLYAAHAQVTERFLPMADAAIFVLDSLEPIKAAELDILEAILHRTRDVFFVQTKIDLVGRDEWPKMIARNQEILAERFGRRLEDPRVWPIASEVLLRAGASPERQAEALVHVSRHREMAAALRAFLARVTQWRRAAEAQAVAAQAHATIRRTLSARLGAASQESSQDRAEIRARAVKRMQEFQAEWGRGGARQRELLERLRKSVDIGRQSFRQALAPGGGLALEVEAEISALASPEKAQAYSAGMGERIVTAAMSRWRGTTESVRDDIHRELGPMMEDVALPAIEVRPSHGDGLTLETPVLDVQNGLWDRFKGGYRECAPMIPIASFVGVMTGLGIIGTPLLCALLPVVFGYSKHNKTLLRTSQQDLRRHAAVCLQQLYRHYFEVDLDTVRYSHVEEHFGKLDKALVEHVQGLADRKLEEARSEIAHLDAEANLATNARAARIEELRRQLSEWDELGRALIGAAVKLRAVRSPAGRPQVSHEGSPHREGGVA